MLGSCRYTTFKPPYNMKLVSFQIITAACFYIKFSYYIEDSFRTIIWILSQFPGAYRYQGIHFQLVQFRLSRTLSVFRSVCESNGVCTPRRCSFQQSFDKIKFKNLYTWSCCTCWNSIINLVMQMTIRVWWILIDFTPRFLFSVSHFYTFVFLN